MWVFEMGIHIIAELWGVDSDKISRVELLRAVVDRVIAKSGVHVVSSSFHQFEPFGVSAVYLLRESHISVHTWPEYSYIALDIFTCGADKAALTAYQLLLDEFKPTSVEKRIIRRVDLGEIRSHNLTRVSALE